jgi:two-component system response regulator VicR
MGSGRGAQAKILVVDDDKEMCNLIALSLRRRGFEVVTARSGKAGIKAAFEWRPELIILDIMMPEMDGWKTCEWLRQVSDIPIVMLTAKTARDDVIHGLQLGADDYITKPFSMKELELRVRAVLRRAKPSRRGEPEVYHDGSLEIDLQTKRVAVDGEAIHLTPTEFQVLSCLVTHKGKVVSREQIISEVWGADRLGDTDSVPLYIHYLRSKIEPNGDDPLYIRTDWGNGYWFAPRENPGSNRAPDEDD